MSHDDDEFAGDHFERATPIAARFPRWRRAAAFVLGLALLIGAIIVLAQQRHAISDALRAIGDHPPSKLFALVALLLGSVLANVLLTGGMFSLLMRPHGRVGLFEMQAVIAAATLLNYLPLRPGFLGRIAYHKAVNGIAVRHTVKAMVQAVMLSAATCGYLALVALACRRFALADSWPLALAIAPLPVLLAPALASALARRDSQRVSERGLAARQSPGFIAAAGAIRLIDVLAIALRYHAAFALIGSPIDWTAALAFACISVIATLVPLVSNGLGLREWAVGLLAPAIAARVMELGLTADLLNRAAEIAIAALAGAPATLWLARRIRRRKTRSVVSENVAMTRDSLRAGPD